MPNIEGSAPEYRHAILDSIVVCRERCLKVFEKILSNRTDHVTAFLDQCGVPADLSLLDRVRGFYHTCIDAVNKYRDRMGELPFIIDPREAPYTAGWLAALQHVVSGAAGAIDPKDPTGRAAALFAFRRWAEEEDKKKGFPPQVP